MPSANKIIVAAAGGGKTTRIVRHALSRPSDRVALVTYTRNNVQEISDKIYELNGAIPPSVEIWSWYSFLLRELARPYRNFLYNERIETIDWVEGRSDRYAKESDINRFYFARRGVVYSDKIARFICRCNETSNGAVMRRLQQRFDHIFVDEIQDMAGFDLNLIELFLRTNITVTLVGDHRQGTFRTNNAAQNSGYGGMRIINKFKEWHDAGLSVLSYERETFRSNQLIADLADTFFPAEPSTISLNTEITGHDGVFAISSDMVEEYVRRYQPKILRLDRRTNTGGYDAVNFGESKGKTFDRVLIFPHGKGKKWLSTGENSHVTDSSAKLYVGVTRARYSVAFVIDEPVRLTGTTMYSFAKLEP